MHRYLICSINTRIETLCIVIQPMHHSIVPSLILISDVRYTRYEYIYRDINDDNMKFSYIVTL